MKYIGAVLLSLGWCITLSAGEAIVRADSRALQPDIRPRSPLPRQTTETLESWTLRLQDDFFRLRLEDRSSRLPDFMSSQAFADRAQVAFVAPQSLFDPADLNRARAAALQAGDAAQSFDLADWTGWLGRAQNDWQTAIQPVAGLDPARLPAATLFQFSTRTLAPWAGDAVRRPDTFALPDRSRWQAQMDAAVNAGADRLHGWLLDPRSAAQIDRWRAQADRAFDLVDRWRALPAGDFMQPSAVQAELDRLLARLDATDRQLPAAVAARLQVFTQDPAVQRAPAQLTVALDRALRAARDPRLNTAFDQLQAWRRQLAAPDTAAALAQLTQWQTQLAAPSARLDVALTALPTVADLLANGSANEPEAWLSSAANGGWNLRLALPSPAGLKLDAAGVNAQLQALTGGLDLAVDRLRLAPDFAAADRIEFGWGGAHFSLRDGYFGQAANEFSGRDSFLALGATDLSLSGGESARFSDFRFQLRTTPDDFQASASVADLAVEFNHQRWRFDAAHLALQGDGTGLRLRGIVYPHDATGSNAAGVYFEIATRDLQALGLVQQAGQALNARDLTALIELLATRPKLFRDDFLVAFNGRAARLLQAQWTGQLDGGTRLLIDALSGLDDGYRTIALRGNQVARMRELAGNRQYSMLVEQAREVVPEIDILYSHYLRRFGGRPDCMVQPIPVCGWGPVSGVVGAAEGSYATQWFGGLACRLPGGSLYSQRILAGWLYEQAGVGTARLGDPTVLYPQYSYERAGFLQYRYNGWALAYEGRLRPTLQVGPNRRLAFDTQFELGLRQADEVSFANQNEFARPQAFLARYDQASPIGDSFPLFHAESNLQMEFSPAAANALGALVGVGCDADFGYGKVTRGLGLQLPLAPELTPKAYVTFARPRYRVQFLGAWPTAADQVPYAVCQLTWDLNQLSLEW